LVDQGTALNELHGTVKGKVCRYHCTVVCQKRSPIGQNWVPKVFCVASYTQLSQIAGHFRLECRWGYGQTVLSPENLFNET
jgi:hypothetical protein